jgi:undecaprenyl-diphosphatase
MLVGGATVFAAIAADVLAHGRLWQLDEPLRTYLHTHGPAPLVLPLSLVSGLGNLPVIAAVGLLVGLILIRKQRWRAVAVWALALLGSAAICETLKRIFQVPRPMAHTLFAFEPRAGYSFPSGHTMAVTITCGMLTMLLWSATRPRQRRAMLAATAGLSLLVAFGLMDVGVHTLTEVLAAQAVSVAWLGLLRILLPQDANVQEHPAPAAGAA